MTFTVADTGIGMSHQQMQRLFQPFTQADATTTRKYGGTGLGLVITQKFCHMMGGGVTVDSSPNQGSVFTLWLPMTEASPSGNQNHSVDENHSVESSIPNLEEVAP